MREIEGSDPRDWTVAEVGGEAVAYGHALYGWPEHDGRHCYLHLGWVAPEWRGRGVGSELAERLERRCRGKATRDGTLERAEIGANESGAEDSARELLLSRGYSVIYTILQMERPPSLAVSKTPMPASYELRRVLPEHRRQIWQMIGDAYHDSSEAGRGAQVATERDYRADFEGERDDPSLWFVAWRGSRVAGAVLCRMIDGVGEPYEVSVAHAHRRRGLARALLTRGFAEIARREPKQVGIVTRRDFPTQAWRLYESVGFRVVKEFPRWRKAFAPAS